MAEALLELPADLEDGNAVADWAEAVMLLEERETIPAAELKRRLTAGRGGDFEVGLLTAQVETRKRRAGPAYPFAVVDDALVRRDDGDTALYEFLFWASFPGSKVRRSHDYRAIDRFFDRVVLRAVQSYLGPQCRGVRFGTPASDGRPAGFADALVWLADQMDLDRIGSLPPNDDKNDAGADVVVWLPFADARSDLVVGIAQCTLRDAWENKAVELCGNAQTWGGGWIALGREPLTFLAVPFTWTSTAPRFAEIRGLINVVLDRVRLCALAGSPHPDDVDEIRGWCAEMRDDLRDTTPATGRPKDG